MFTNKDRINKVKRLLGLTTNEDETMLLIIACIVSSYPFIKLLTSIPLNDIN